MIQITSSDNQKIKEIVHLRKSGHRKKRNFFVIEGEKEILMANNSGYTITDLFFVDSVPAKKIEIFSKLINQYRISEKILTKISLRENPDGFFAIASIKETDLVNIKLGACPLILILEKIEKPGNLGAILRSADAAGIDAVLLMDPKTDIYNPNTIRSSLGTVFSCQIATGKQKDIFSWLRKNQIITYATTPDTKKLYTDADFQKPCAIIIGTEHEGIDKKTLEMSNEKIKIPMNGKIDSLNASVSAALAIFEAVRQRKK